jgi:hypothetical protein
MYVMIYYLMISVDILDSPNTPVAREHKAPQSSRGGFSYWQACVTDLGYDAHYSFIKGDYC